MIKINLKNQEKLEMAHVEIAYQIIKRRKKNLHYYFYDERKLNETTIEAIKNMDISKEDYKKFKKLIKIFIGGFSEKKISDYLKCRDLTKCIRLVEVLNRLTFEYQSNMLSKMCSNSNDTLKKYYSDTYQKGVKGWYKEKRKKYLQENILVDVNELKEDINQLVQENLFTDDQINNFFKVSAINFNKVEDFNRQVKSELDKDTHFNNKDNYDELIKCLLNNLSGKLIKLNNVFSYIFCYDSYKKEARNIIIPLMDIRVCPYCNRQYITNYKDITGIKEENSAEKTIEYEEEEINEEKRIATADIDHYYCKSKYPYLAISLYNFIPSCQICNSRLKLSKDFYRVPHINPITDDISEKVYFKTNIGDKDIEPLFKPTYHGNDKFKILLKNEFDTSDKMYERVENSKCTFKIDEIYQTHIDYVLELIEKAKHYHHCKIKELDKIDGLFDGEEEIRRLIFGRYLEDDLNKWPLSKLSNDICKEFGIKQNIKD